MPLKLITNNNRPPIYLRDYVVRGERVDATQPVNSILSNVTVRFTNEEIADKKNEWWLFIKGTSDFSNELLTDYVLANYGERVFLDKYANNFDGWEEFSDFGDYVIMVSNDISAMLNSNKEKYRRLYDSMIAEYNPLWNVDAIIDTTTKSTDSGHDTITYNGSEKDTIAGRETTTQNGSVESSTSGEERNTRGQGSTTITAKTTFNDSDFENTERVIETPTGDYDKHEVDEMETTTTYNDVITDLQYTGRENTHSYSNRNDKTDYGRVNDGTEHTVRQGNIGVTSSQQLLEAEREVALFSFVDVVARDIVNLITYAVY